MAAITLNGSGVMRLPGRLAETALHEAARNGDDQRVRDLLQAGHQVDCYDAEQQTPLFVAASADRASVVQVLLEAGAHQGLLARDGVCALHEAVRMGFVKVVEVLLAQQVRIGRFLCKHHEWHDPLLYVASMHTITAGGAASNAIASLLVAAGVMPNDCASVPDNGEFSAFDSDEDVAAVTRATKRQAATARIQAIFHEDQLQKAALALARSRAVDVTIALAGLGLPALLSTMIIDEACAPPGANLRLYDSWQIATKVKHFHD